MGHLLPAPQPFDKLQSFLEPPHPATQGDAERIELHLPVTQPHAEHEIASGDHVQGGDGLRHIDRVVQGEEEYSHSRGHFARLGHQAGQKGHQRQLLVVALVQIVLPAKQGVPAPFPHRMHHGDLLLQGADHVHIQILLIGEIQSDFQRDTSFRK